MGFAALDVEPDPAARVTVERDCPRPGGIERARQRSRRCLERRAQGCREDAADARAKTQGEPGAEACSGAVAGAEAKAHEHFGDELRPTRVSVHCLGRENEDDRLVAGSLDHASEGVVELSVDVADGVAEMLGSLGRVEEVPELVAHALRLAESAGEEIPLLSVEQVQEERELCVEAVEETIEQLLKFSIGAPRAVARRVRARMGKRVRPERILAVAGSELVEQLRRRARRSERTVMRS